MSRMVRKQLYLSAEQDSAVSAMAERTGVSQAVVVREAVARYLAADQEAARRAAADEFLRDVEGYARLGWTAGGSGPSRESLHERGGDRRDR